MCYQLLQELSPEGQAQGVNATWLETIREQGLQLVSKLEKMQQEAQASRVELLKVQRLRVKENQQLKVMQEALTQAIQNLTALEARAQVSTFSKPLSLLLCVNPSVLDPYDPSLWLFTDEARRSDLID